MTPILPAIELRRLTKRLPSGDRVLTILDAVDLSVATGEFVAVLGPSGSGKSTLLGLAAGLDRPTSGEVLIDGAPIQDLSEDALARLRRRKIGFVFQSFNLVPTLTARENITLPLDIAGTKVDKEWFDTVVETVGLADRLSHRPNALSGGQQQRVACARALVSRPAIVFADEPTGNLDSRSSAEILGFLRRSVDEFGQSIVMVTHDPNAAGYADRVLFLSDGRIVDEIVDPTADTVLERMRGFEPAGRRG